MVKPVKFDLKAYLLEKRIQVDSALDEYLPKVDGLTADLIEAMRYSLFGGGRGCGRSFAWPVPKR